MFASKACVQNSARRSILFLLVAISLMRSIDCYSLDGEWRLSLNSTGLDFQQNRYSNQSQGIERPNITFQFSETVDSEQQIQKILTVRTCRNMFYTYSAQNDSFIPIFRRFGNNTRECMQNEVNTIRSRLESVFYFELQGDQLILMGPDQQIAFELQKVPSPSQSLRGRWVANEVNGKAMDPSQSKNRFQVLMNEIELCDGEVVFGYLTRHGNQIDVLEENRRHMQFTYAISNEQSPQESSSSSASQNDTSSVQEDSSGDQGDGDSGDACDQDSELALALKKSKFYSRSPTTGTLKMFDQQGRLILQATQNSNSVPTQPFEQSQLYDKWFIHSINNLLLVEQGIEAYYYYYLIITSDRFRFYGGCNVQFSFYDLSFDQEMSVNEVLFRDVKFVDKPNCRYVNRDREVLNRLFEKAVFVRFDERRTMLTFYDQNWGNVMQFTPRVPQVQDRFRTANF